MDSLRIKSVRIPPQQRVPDGLRVAEVVIGSAGESLTLRRDDSDLVVDTVIAELHAGTLSASKQVVHSYVSGFTDLVAFFELLSHDWRGWEGPACQDRMRPVVHSKSA